MRKTLGNSRKGSRSLIAFEIVHAYGCLCRSQSGDRRLIRIPFREHSTRNGPNQDSHHHLPSRIVTHFLIFSLPQLAGGDRKHASW